MVEPAVITKPKHRNNGKNSGGTSILIYDFRCFLNSINFVNHLYKLFTNKLLTTNKN